MFVYRVKQHRRYITTQSVLQEIRSYIRNLDTYDSVLVALNSTTTFKEFQEEKKRKSVPVDNIISCPWNKQRLESLLQLSIGAFTRLLKEHPVILVGYETRDGTIIYVPSDGNHRVEVAKRYGLHKIEAFVQGYYTLPKTKRALLTRQGLFIEAEEGFRFIVEERRLPPIPLLEKILFIRNVILVQKS